MTDVVESLPGMYEVLDSIFSIEKKKEKEKKNNCQKTIPEGYG
jgi:hypothetical protein